MEIRRLQQAVWLFCGHFGMTAVRSLMNFDRRSGINDCFRLFTNRYCLQFLVICALQRAENSDKAPDPSCIITNADGEVEWARKSQSFTSPKNTSLVVLLLAILNRSPIRRSITNCGSLMSPVRQGKVVGCNLNCVVF